MRMLLTLLDLRKTTPRGSRAPSRTLRPRAVLAGMAAAALAGGARAQVIQIDPEGGLQTFSGPRVFTAEGSRAITLARPRPAGTRPRPAGRSVEAFHARPPGRTPAAAPAEAFMRAATAANLSPDLVTAVAWRESHFNPRALSRAGAAGEMQLMPGTARALRVDASDPAQNLRGGAAYLATLLRRYDGDLVKALAAYNAGPASVDRYGGVPPYRETQAYVAAILDQLSQVVVPVSTAGGTGR